MEKIKSVWKKFKTFIIAFLLIIASIIGYSVVFPPTPPVGTTHNFGYETAGTAGSTSIYETIVGSVFPCTETGTANTITVSLAISDMGDASAVYIGAAIYKHSDSTKVGETTWISCYSTFTKTWKTCTFGTPPSLTAIDYVLVVLALSDYEYVPPTVVMYYDAGSANQGHYQTGQYNFHATQSFIHNNNKYSVYCSYSYTAPKVPTYNNLGINTIMAGENATFHVYWHSTSGDGNLDRAYFAWTENCTSTTTYLVRYNNPQYWQNETVWDNAGVLNKWANITKTLPTTEGFKIQFRFSCNNTAGWNTTNIYTFYTSGVVLWNAGSSEHVIYVANSHHKENYLYTRVSIESDYGINTVLIDWYNGTWTNLTMTRQDSTNFYYRNMTNLQNGIAYSFRIYATDTDGNVFFYNWTKDGRYTLTEQIYVYLNYSTETFDYTNYYWYEWRYDWENYTVRRKCLPHQQGTDGGGDDMAVFWTTQPTTKQEVYCTVGVGGYIDANTTINTMDVNNIYVHYWWSSKHTEGKVGFAKINTTWFAWDVSYSIYKNQAKTTVEAGEYYEGWNYTTYYLEASLWNLTSQNYNVNDNTLYEIFAGVESKYGGGTSADPAVIGAPEFESFIIINLPNNTTLQNLDSDNDDWSDYQELFQNWTDPFDADTDADGFIDSIDNDPLHSAAKLLIGWNEVFAWNIDVGHTLGAVNASLNYDSVSWSICVLEYTNGTRYVFVYGYSYNTYIEVLSTDDKFYIYCTEEGHWFHTYP